MKACSVYTYIYIYTYILKRKAKEKLTEFSVDVGARVIGRVSLDQKLGHRGIGSRGRLGAHGLHVEHGRECLLGWKPSLGDVIGTPSQKLAIGTQGAAKSCHAYCSLHG